MQEGTGFRMNEFGLIEENNRLSSLLWQLQEVPVTSQGMQVRSKIKTEFENRKYYGKDK